MRFLLTLIFCLMVSLPAFAKYESGSEDAASIVLYGKNGSNLVPIKVDTDGSIYTSGNFEGDVSVGGDLTVGGDVEVDGALYVDGGIYAHNIGGTIIMVDGSIYPKTSAGINSAIDYAESLGLATVQLVCGRYLVDEEIILQPNSDDDIISLNGYGRCTQLYVNSNLGSDVIEVAGTHAYHWRLSNFSIYDPDINADNGIRISSVISSDVWGQLENIWIYGVDDDGYHVDHNAIREITLTNVYTSNCGGDGFEDNGSDHKYVNIISANNKETGWNINGGNSQFIGGKSFGSGLLGGYNIKVSNRRNLFSGVDTQEGWLDNIYVDEAENSFVGVQAEKGNLNNTRTNNPYAGIHLTAKADKTLITGCKLGDWSSPQSTDYGIIIEDGAEDNLIEGNQFYFLEDGAIYATETAIQANNIGVNSFTGVDPISNIDENLYFGGSVGIGTLTASSELGVGGGNRTSTDGVDDVLIKDDLEVDGEIYVDGGVLHLTPPTFIIGRKIDSATYTVGAKSGLPTYGILSQSNENGMYVSNYWGLYFSTGNHARMNITSSGKVGIGTTSPTGLLTVSGTLVVTDTSEGSQAGIDLCRGTGGVICDCGACP